jgi:hypothetical protein
MQTHHRKPIYIGKQEGRSSAPGGPDRRADDRVDHLAEVTGGGVTAPEERAAARIAGLGELTTAHRAWWGKFQAAMLSQGGHRGHPAPLASRFHSIPAHFLSNLHAI